MTPEQDIERVITSVHAQSGHWPYTKDADLYIGYRPGEEEFSFGAGRILRTQVSYDIVICAVRTDAAAAQMEALRYRLYAALIDAGWHFDGAPGPESYAPAQGQFMWPVRVKKGFAVGRDGQPCGLT